MKKLINGALALCFLLTCISYVQAQDEINRAEFFAGFSHNRLDTGIGSEDFDEDVEDVFTDRVGANGFNAAITGNFSKYVGAKFDFSVHSKSDSATFDGSTFRSRYRIYNFLGGIQIKNNKKDGPRVKPFAHFMAGVAKQTFRVEGADLTPLIGESSFETSSTNFALAIGGGLDVRLSKRVDLRLIQLDYNPTFVKDREFDDFTLDGRMQNNFRIGIGFVFH